ncbi:MAG: hypothetical protein RIS64_730 [Bacteroidota bacterium]|jgi:uncharacterized protein (DUF58 family)
MAKNLFLTHRFFIGLGILIGIFLASFPFKILFPVAQAMVVMFVALALADTILLFHRNTRLYATRRMPTLMSLGDPNPIELRIENPTGYDWRLTVIDELPFQFQKRDFELQMTVQAGRSTETIYDLTPTERGEYHFGDILLLAASSLGLVQRRFRIPAAAMIPTYPSVVQMKKYELKAVKQIANQYGIKKIRRLGHSYEFEQIKNYVPGDDIRTLNWKASGRRATLMVNQYEDERSQQVYCILDKSRVMRLPFNGLTLLDHSINTALVISNIILQKKDRVGLFTFSDKLGTTLAADAHPRQLQRILEELYHQKEGSSEANYELLYYAVRKLVRGRSLLMFFTNYESLFALERALPTLRLLNNLHLLVVVVFKNTEIENFALEDAENTESIYNQAVAQKYAREKMQMVQKLRQHGIQAILTRPEDLSIHTINKYLELKSRGLI